MDKERCARKLWEAYESARGQPINMMALHTTKGFDPQRLMQRLATNHPGLVKQHLDAPWGGVR